VDGELHFLPCGTQRVCGSWRSHFAKRGTAKKREVGYGGKREQMAEIRITAGRRTEKMKMREGGNGESPRKESVQP